MKKILGAICLIIISAAIIIYGGEKAITSYIVTQNDSIAKFTINEDDTISDICSNLAKEGIVKNKYVALGLMIKSNQSAKIHHGEYTIVPEQKIDNLISQITVASGKSNEKKTVSVTFPEGFTVKQMAERLEDANICSAEEFITTVQQWVSDDWFIADLPLYGNRLEGYLYPDTYEFNTKTPAKEVVQKMLSRFNQLVSPYKEEIKQSGYSIKDIVLMASLIEKEAKYSEDMVKISSVIHNRLEADMPLQIDASILYSIGHKPVLTTEDLKIDDPYNLYIYKGLPPTPICSPSINSIVAAIKPEKTDYLYYVVDSETGYHHFANTYEEHQTNIAKYYKKTQ